MLVDARDGQARKAQLPVAVAEFVEGGDGIEAVGQIEFKPTTRMHAAEPAPDGRGSNDGVALPTQPACHLGEGCPGPPQGEQFGCVTVELRPALCSSHRRYP